MFQVYRLITRVGPQFRELVYYFYIQNGNFTIILFNNMKTPSFSIDFGIDFSQYFGRNLRLLSIAKWSLSNEPGPIVPAEILIYFHRSFGSIGQSSHLREHGVIDWNQFQPQFRVCGSTDIGRYCIQPVAVDSISWDISIRTVGHIVRYHISFHQIHTSCIVRSQNHITPREERETIRFICNRNPITDTNQLIFKFVQLFFEQRLYDTVNNR